MKARWLVFCVGLACAAAILVAPFAAPQASAGVTERVSVSSAGDEGNNPSQKAAISADGRYVAFESTATNLVAGDTNNVADVFVHDRLTGITERVSLVDGTGAQATGASQAPAISADGTLVAFHSLAALVAGDTNGNWDVFVRDRVHGTTERVSVSSGGAQTNQSSQYPSISANGRYVAFQSNATNFVTGDTNGYQDIFVRDTQDDTTVRVSVSSSGDEGNNSSSAASISADGALIAFASQATNLVTGDTNAGTDIFVHSTADGTTERVSVSSAGAQATAGSSEASISGEGRFVAFSSLAGNLVPGDIGFQDVFLRDLQTSTTEMVSVSSFEVQESGTGSEPSVSGDGRYVTFASTASNFVPGDTNARQDIFVRDRQFGTTQRVSISSAGAQGDNVSTGPAISADGEFVAFESTATTLVAGDTNAKQDVFVHDRGLPAPEFSVNGGAACAHSTQVSLSVTCGSWVEVRFRNDPGDYGLWQDCTATMPWTLTSGDGPKQVALQARDALLNESAEGYDTVILDTTVPTNVTISINTGAVCTASHDVTLTLGALTAAEMRFRNEQGAWSAWEPYAPTKAWALSAGGGTKTVGFQCRNTCGFEAAEVTDTVVVPTFTDVPCGHGFLLYVEAMVREGITAGCLADPPRYCPTAPVTRAQMAKFLCLAAGKTELFPPTPTFADVQPGPWYYGWVERLADPASWPGGIPPTSGCACPAGYPQGARCFCPNDPVTREQMAKFLCLATGHAAMPSCSGVFADVSSGGWACPWIERLADSGSWGGTPVTSGCVCPPGYPGGAKCYCPKENCTRAQMAKFLVLAFGIPH